MASSINKHKCKPVGFFRPPPVFCGKHWRSKNIWVPHQLALACEYFYLSAPKSTPLCTVGSDLKCSAAGWSTLFSWKGGPTNNAPPQTETRCTRKTKKFLEDFPAINQVVTLTLIHIICQYNERRKLLINKDLILRQKIVWFALIATTKAANLGQQMAIGMIYVRNNLRFEVGETLRPPFLPKPPKSCAYSTLSFLWMSFLLSRVVISSREPLSDNEQWQFLSSICNQHFPYKKMK